MPRIGDYVDMDWVRSLPTIDPSRGVLPAPQYGSGPSLWDGVGIGMQPTAPAPRAGTIGIEGSRGWQDYMKGFAWDAVEEFGRRGLDKFADRVFGETEPSGPALPPQGGGAQPVPAPPVVISDASGSAPGGVSPAIAIALAGGAFVLAFVLGRGG